MGDSSHNLSEFLGLSLITEKGEKETKWKITMFISLGGANPESEDGNMDLIFGKILPSVTN